MHDNLIQLTEELLHSIATADWETYEKLCDETITAFEPESRGNLVDGLAFHRFYFDLKQSDSPKQTSILNPHIRMLGEDAGVISYTRLVQSLDGDGNPVSSTAEETRIWQRIDGEWKHVHFHRSPC